MNYPQVLIDAANKAMDTVTKREQKEREKQDLEWWHQENDDEIWIENDIGKDNGYE